MIFNLIVVIATIITVSNSTPILIRKGELTNFNDNNNVDGLISKRQIDLQEFINDPVNYLQNDATTNPLDNLERNTLNFIDMSGDQLKEIIERTNKNIKDAIDPVKDIFKAKIKLARRLATLFINETRNLPTFAMGVINNFSPNSQESIDDNK